MGVTMSTMPHTEVRAPTKTIVAPPVLDTCVVARRPFMGRASIERRPGSPVAPTTIVSSGGQRFRQVQAPSCFGSHFAPTQEAKTGLERMTPTGNAQVAHLYHRVNFSTHNHIVRDSSHNTVMVWSAGMLHETGEKCERVLYYRTMIEDRPSSLRPHLLLSFRRRRCHRRGSPRGPKASRPRR